MLRPRTALAAIVLCAASLTALTACSSSPSTAGASSGSGSGSGSGASVASQPAAAAVSNVARPADICALLSKQEATTALGTTITTTYEADKHSCNYDGPDESFLADLSPTNLPEFSTSADLLKLDIGAMHAISGVGDQAAGNAKGIVFRKGSVIITIEVSMGTDHTTEAELTSLAKVMVGHLS